MSLQITAECWEHPEYQASFKPKVKCEPCWAIWIMRRRAYEDVGLFDMEFNIKEGEKLR